MPSVLSLAELDDQHVELLPGRTVLSMFVSQPTDGGSSSDGSDTMDLLRMTNMLPVGTGVGWGDHGANSAGDPAA
ncbi:MAG: hypothetical protein WAN20_13910 [Pseudonocardiaceae bacterium]|jgi:hypothetical protein|nr:hypothetical protein [Pseudonocardiaceae bacterium]